MVETKQIDIELIARSQLQHVGDKHLHADRNIAHADKALKASMTIHRFGYHARRVGKVNHPGVRTDFLNIFHNVKNDRNGAQTFKQSARAVGFLA